LLADCCFYAHLIALPPPSPSYPTPITAIACPSIGDSAKIALKITIDGNESPKINLREDGSMGEVPREAGLQEGRRLQWGFSTAATASTLCKKLCLKLLSTATQTLKKKTNAQAFDPTSWWQLDPLGKLV
jgi:hypothetical protein